MEEKERSRSPSRRARRVEEVVGRWLRRSRDSSSRERSSFETKPNSSSGPSVSPIKLTVKIQRDLHLDCHGFSFSTQSPLMVKEVITGSTADGRLVPGDQVLMINNVMADNLSVEEASDIIRDSWDTVTLSVLRHAAVPKSSFLTAEKRARLRTNPVKVRFAEEVVVNGYTQGNSLLFLPNVLKVYLENGQTKAFKFEAKTTVKDIVLTLKEKLSIRAIEHFGLVLEEQYSITKLLMLHEEEYIQQVVHRKEAHGYRCLFRVCFLPVEPLDLLHEDPVAFEYLYLQGISDVLQERFAVEMKCNTALRLAALQMQERLNSSGLNQRASLKTITKKWGLENFVSPTLLRNMSDKDLRKAINYHMKKIQALGEPKQKGISATEAQLYYLAQLGELQSYGGKCFTATILFQDRQPTVSLLVGARYGVSQVVNHKLGLVTVLAEFNQISRLDLLPESERVSLVKIYLEDVKQLTLLMESLAAKDLSVVVTGYCRLLMDKAQSTHTWSSPVKTHRTQAEQGGGEGRSPVHSKGQEDYLMENNSDNVLVDLHFSIDGTKVASTQEVNGIQKNKEIGVDERSGEEQNIISGEDVKDVKPNQDKLLEMSIGRSFDSHTNSGTFDNLDEDDLLTCSSNFPVNLEVHYPYLLDTTEVDDTRTHPVITDNNNEAFMCFAELSLMADCLPSPPEATDEEEERHDCSLSQPFDCPYALEEDLDDLDDLEDEEGNFQLPASGTLTLDIPVCLAGSPQANDMEEPFFSQVQAPVLQPSPSFVDSSSEDEFFDANDGFAPAAEASMAGVSMTRTLNLDNISLLEQEMEHEESQRAEGQGVQERLAESLYPIKKVRKRCSILKANLPLVDSASKNKDELNSFDSNSTDMLLNTEEQLGSQSTINSTVEDSQCNFIKTEASENQVLSIDGLEINVDLTEFKPLSDHLISTVHAEVGNSECSSFNCGVSDRNLDCASSSNQVQVTQVGTEKKIIKMMINDNNNSADKNEGEHSLCGIQGHEKEVTQAQVGICSVKKTSALSPYPSLDNSPNSEEVRDELYLDTDTMDHCKRRNICIPLVTKKSISLSCESLLLVGTDVPTVMTDVVEKINATTEIPPDSNLQNHPFRLAFTNSSLRAKIRRLPCCLSQSQENLSTFGTSSSDKNSPNGLFENSQDATDVTLVMEPSTGEVVSEFAEDTTELHINVSEDINKNLKEVEEGKSIVKVNQISYNYSFLPSNSNSESLLSVTSEDLILQNFTHHNLTPCTPGSVEQVEKNVCYMVEMTSGTTAPCESKQPQPWTCTKRKMACIQGSNDKCPNETQPSMETCGCQNAYSNCFGMEPERSTFDEELTVQEYSCQSQGIFKDRLMTTAPFASPSMPSFSRNSIPQSTSSELSPLLSPMNPIDFVPQDSLEEILNQLQNRHYRQPEGFALLQRDLAQLLLILRGNAHSRGKHHWETCVAHLSENKHILHGEARKLMSGCQRVIRLGQTPEELLLALGESFRTLVRLVVMCLWFSSCSHCEGGLAQVMRSLTEITKDYGDFSLAAEQACGRKSCHDLTIKVLAKQCTTLTSSVFCLTQLYCTLASV